MKVTVCANILEEKQGIFSEQSTKVQKITQKITAVQKAIIEFLKTSPYAGRGEIASSIPVNIVFTKI